MKRDLFSNIYFFYLFQTPLHLAVRDNSVEIIEMLVAFGANPSIRDIRGNSSLHMATAIRSSESLKILAESLASKDDVNAFNNFGELVIFFLNLHLCIHTFFFVLF